MKKASFIVWTIIIFGSVFTIFQISKGFDLEKINSPIKDTFLQATSTISATSTSTFSTTTALKNTSGTSRLFVFDGISYQKEVPSSIFKKIMVGQHVFFAKIADTESTRAQGLSGVSNMSDDAGMLFVFETTGTHGFWMKDMKFPLDLIWIDDALKIVGISEHILPETYPQIFSSNAPIRYVLEINAGIASENGLRVGDLITF